MDAALLDTDILSEVLKQRNPQAPQKASDYLAQHGQFAISAITRYEVIRGLKEKQATAQLARFATFCQHTLIVPVTDDIFDQAADLWAAGRQQGRTPADADLLIAATAIQRQRTRVTGNTSQCQWIPGLALDNGRNP